MRRIIGTFQIVIFVGFIALLLQGCSRDSNKGFKAEKRLYRKGWNINISQTNLFKAKSLKFNTIESKDTDGETILQKNTGEIVESRSEAPRSWFPDEMVLNTRCVDDDSDTQQPNKTFDSGGFQFSKSALKYNENKLSKDPEVPIATVGFIALMIALANLILLMWIPFVGVLSAILCLVFASKALKIDNKNAKSYGWASVIITGFTLLVSILMTLVLMINLQLFGNI